MRHYAMSWTHGRGTSTTNHRGYPHGDEIVRAARYFSFPTKVARDLWCEGGSPYVTGRDYREPLFASDRELRVMLTRDESDGMSGRYDARVSTAEAYDDDPSYLSKVELDARRACEKP